MVNKIKNIEKERYIRQYNKNKEKLRNLHKQIIKQSKLMNSINIIEIEDKKSYLNTWDEQLFN